MEERAMTPLQMSARFAAYIWFLRQPENIDRTKAHAHDYAKKNWEKFLPVAPEGFGRLLVKLAKAKKRERVRPTAVVA
jgi:hypothetical protein